MREFTTKIEVKDVSPNQIVEFLMNLDDDNYRLWHPRAHKKFRFIKKTKEVVGTRFFFEEKIGTVKVAGLWRITEATDKHIVAETRMFGLRVVLILLLEAISGVTLVTHIVKFEVRFPFIGEILERLFEIMGKRFIDKVHKHAQEEFKNLENLIKA